MMSAFRKLAPSEIATLEAQGCSSSGWDLVEVAPGFSTEAVKRVHFAGRIRIGASCTLEDIGLLECTAGADFGIGRSVSVLDETGGRSVVMHTGLNWQEALDTALGRRAQEIPECLPEVMEIGEGASVRRCGAVRNVNVGPFARLEGASLLENGTISSSAEAPSFTGISVIAKGFVFAEGSHIDGASQLKDCFVGQASRIDCGFSAEESLIFSNCHFEKGEACAIIAGPFTVSHHKSSLLIGGVYSYFNAGSGTNFSNHLYKTGPVHWGICEKGVKTASGAYLAWPARIGAHSLVMGKHSSHPDSSAFPFSYLVEGEAGQSRLIPGVMLKSWGLRRDGEKWKSRDRRTSKCLSDTLEPEIFTPAMHEAIKKAAFTLEAALVGGNPKYQGRGYSITSSDMVKGLEYYRLALREIESGDGTLKALALEDKKKDEALATSFQN